MLYDTDSQFQNRSEHADNELGLGPFLKLTIVDQMEIGFLENHHPVTIVWDKFLCHMLRQQHQAQMIQCIHTVRAHCRLGKQVPSHSS